MRAFAALLDRLSTTPGRNDKLRLMMDYFRATPDPDRGWALAALTDTLPFSLPVRRTLGALMADKVDAELYRLSRDYVGDTAETVALLWPDGTTAEAALRLADVAETLAVIGRHELAATLAGWLDRLDPTGRWALLKLLTGGLRVGVSARLAKTALADAWGRPVADIEEVWHGLTPPYDALFARLEQGAALPDIRDVAVFRPMMLAHPLNEDELATLDVAELAVEWKWDGIRVQLGGRGGATRIFSRKGDEIGTSFPELAAIALGDVTLDGELLVVRDGVVQPFNELQQRLNRKTVSRRLLASFPAQLMLYDILALGADDVRALPFRERRQRLEAWFAERQPPSCQLSELLAFESRAALEAVWSGTRAAGVEGLMLKRWSSPYLGGRPKGHWYKWKRAPLTADCVLMYAQRGAGRRSSFYSDYTFGVWRQDVAGGRSLVPVGKAYSGFSDEELVQLDRWVHQHGRESFGPVRAVEPGLVLEVAFDAVQPSRRHKSGIAMRFPRIHRIRWDKPAHEADNLETLRVMIVT